jgi:hypothetical protein
MHIEKKFQILMFISFVFFLYLSVYKLNISIIVLLILFVFLILNLILIIIVLSEIYFRIQHNIDKRQFNLDKMQQIFENRFYSLLTEINKNFSYLFNGTGLFKQTEMTFSNLSILFDLFIKEKAKEALQNIAPDLFNYKTVLYVGANQYRSYFLEDFHAAGYRVTLLEIFKKNAEFYKSLGWVNEVIQENIINFKPTKKYDVVFWWHGPEHVQKDKLDKTLKTLEKSAKEILVLGCPIGKVLQESSYGNVHEKHLSYYEIGYFEKLGYKTHYIGRRDHLFSNITAVKHIR